MKKILKFFTFVVMVLGLVSCGDLNNTPIGITISSADNVRIIQEHETLQLQAKVYPDNASQEVLWSTSDEDIAIVNEDGLVTAVSTGNVNVIAKAKE